MKFIIPGYTSVAFLLQRAASPPKEAAGNRIRRGRAASATGRANARS